MDREHSIVERVHDEEDAMRTVFSSVPAGLGFAFASVGAYSHEWLLLVVGAVLLIVGGVVLWRCEE